MAYKEGELEELHTHLYDILSHTIEACNKLGIKYFIIGGTAIGAHFDKAILPWDDDIDIGMERDDYDRFLREAPAVLAKGYTLQSPENEPLSPYYFAKVRKDDTLFVTEEEQNLDIHHGIYIDIFPFDNVPDNNFVEKIHRHKVRILSNAFVSKQIGLKGGYVSKLLYKIFSTPLPARWIYSLLVIAQRWFNHCNTRYISIVKMPLDQIERSTLHPPQIVEFGGMEVAAPNDMLTYLNHHYPGLHRDVAPEEQINHSPIILNFNTKN